MMGKIASAFRSAEASVGDLVGYCKHLFELNRRGEMGVGDVILGIVFAVMMSGVAVLVGGLFFAKTGDVFDKVGINSTNNADWYNLFVSAGEYATTGIGIALVSLVIVGIGALLWAILGYFKR